MAILDNVLTIFLLFALLLYKPPFIEEVIASPPSFPLQGIDDNLNDWSLLDIGLRSSEKNITNCGTQGQDIPYPEITGVSYFSDGRTLNSTVWQSSPFTEPISNLSSDIKEIERTYSMLIFIDSVYNTPQHYLLTISWNPINKTWTRIIQQSSPSFGKNNIFDTWENRVLAHKDNYSGFFNTMKNYIDLSLDLNTISSPSQYSVVSYVSETYLSKNYRLCHIEDITDLIHIPPPEFSMIISPSSLSLRPGEQKNVELGIKNNNALLNSHVILSTNQTNGVEIKFSSNEIYVPPYGIATLPLTVKTGKDITERPHTIPISTTITFPTSLTNLFNGEELVNTESASITMLSNFTVTVLSPLTFEEQLNNFYSSWLVPISAMIGVAAVIAPLFIYIYKRQKKKRKNSNDSIGSNCFEY